MNKIKKALVAGIMSITVLSMSMLAVPFSVGAEAMDGDLIKMDGLSSVYYLSEGKRFVFPNENTYFSWYSDFSSVVTISQSELESYPLGSNVTVRPGTKLVKITTNPNVYAVAPGGDLILIPDEATAKTLYGDNWASMVIDVPDAFFTNYTITGEELDGTAYPTGTLIKEAGGSDIYYIAEDGSARMIADEAAFEANMFQWDNVIETGLTLPAAGDDVAGAETDIINVAEAGTSGTGIQPGAGTGLSAGLSSDTPASATVPSTAAGVVFTKFDVKAAADGDVTVKNITVKRIGVGATDDIAKVYIYDGMDRLTTGKTVNSTSNTITFNSINIAVPAGTTKTLSIVADIAAGKSGNHAFGIVAASDIVTDGATVSGSFPITGNTMSLSSTNVGTLTLTENNGTTGVDAKIGEEDIELADFSFANDNEEDVALSSIVLTNGGNALSENLGNISLYYNGAVIATGEMDSNRKIAFTFDPITIDKGASNEEFRVKADIESGMNNTVKLYIAQSSDIVAVGQTFGYNAGSVITAFDSSSDVATITITGSDINVNLATDNAETVIADQKDFVFGQLDVVAKESIEVVELRVTIDETDGASNGVIDIDDLQLRNSATGETIDGTVVSGAGDTAATDVVWKFESFYWETGEGSWAVRGDIPSDAQSGDAYKITIDLDPASTLNARYQASNNDVSASDLSTNTLTGKTKTIGASTLTVTASTFNDGDAVANTENLPIAGGKMSANSVSDVTVTEISFAGNNDATVTGSLVAGDVAYLDKTNISSITLLVDGVPIKTKSGGSLTDGAVTFNNFDKDVTILSGKNVIYQVVMNVAGTLDTANKTIRVHLTGITARDTNNDTVTAKNTLGTALDATHRIGFGRVVTLQDSGKVTVTMDSTVDSVDRDKYILAGSTGNKIARVKIKAEYEDALIQKIYISNDDLDADASVGIMRITDADGNVLYSEYALPGIVGVASSTVPMSNDDGLFTVPVGTSYYYITLDTRAIGEGPIDTAKSQDYFKISLTSVEAQGVGSGVDITGASLVYGSGLTRTAVSKVATVVGVKIAAITDQSSTLDLATGEQKVFQFKVDTASGNNASSTAGDILKAEITTLKVTTNYKSGTVSTAVPLKLYRDGKSGYVTSSVPSIGGVATFDLATAVGDWLATDNDIDAGSSATFYIKALIDSADTNDYVQCKLATLDGTTSTGSLVWTDQTGNSMGSLLLGMSELSGATVN